MSIVTLLLLGAGGADCSSDSAADAGPDAALDATRADVPTSVDARNDGPVVSDARSDSSAARDSTLDALDDVVSMQDIAIVPDEVPPPDDVPPPPPTCPDGACGAGEDCTSCPQDCGACPPPTCPNGACDPGESCGTCALDCVECNAATAPASCDNGPFTGEPACGGISNAYTTAAVNVGYYAFRAVRDTSILSAPGCATGQLVQSLSAGQGVGVQSTRNPTCSSSPPMRAPVAGYVWGYARGSGVPHQSGWIAMADLEWVGYTPRQNCADGPAAADFEVAANPHDGCRATECTAGSHTCTATNSPTDGADNCGGTGVDYVRSVNADTLYLRYAPGSTAFHYLHRGDQVHVRYHHAIRGVTWAFVTVTASACTPFTPVGADGWCEESFLQ